MIILWKIGLKTFGKAASVKPVWKVHIDSQRCNLSNFPCLIENFLFLKKVGYFGFSFTLSDYSDFRLCTIVWPCPKCTAFLQCNFLNYGLRALFLMILNYNSSRVSKYTFPFVIMQWYIVFLCQGHFFRGKTREDKAWFAGDVISVYDKTLSLVRLWKKRLKSCDLFLPLVVD